jgi:hypothetical protein
LPSVEDPRSLGLSIRSGMPHRLHLGTNIEGSGMYGGKIKKFDLFKDLIIPVGKKSGDPFKKSVGVNPFEMGFALGRDVIAPELMKIIPPRGRGVHMLGGQRGIRPMPQMATMGSGL